MSIESLIKSVGEGMPLEDLNTEGIVMDALRDLVKDEIKDHLKRKVDENPALKEELKEAVELFIEAKLKETFAAIKLAKAGTKLGLTMVPVKMVDDLSREFSKVFEKELITLLDKSL